MLCPICKHNEGVMLFTSVAPCTFCERGSLSYKFTIPNDIEIRKQWEANPGFLKWKKLPEFIDYNTLTSIWPSVMAGIFVGDHIAVPKEANFGAFKSHNVVYKRFELTSLPIYDPLRTGKASIFPERAYWSNQ